MGEGVKIVEKVVSWFYQYQSQENASELSGKALWLFLCWNKKKERENPERSLLLRIYASNNIKLYLIYLEIRSWNRNSDWPLFNSPRISDRKAALANSVYV